jgi:hypothetical protein
VDIGTDLVESLAGPEVSLQTSLLHLFTFWKSSFRAFDSNEVLVLLHVVLSVHSSSGRPIVLSVLSCTCQRLHWKAASHQKFAKLGSFPLRTIHNSCPLRAFRHSSRCASGKDSMSKKNLCIFSNTEAASGYLFIMALHSDFRNDSSCLHYFRNPGSGTSTILVNTQIHSLCVASHSTAHNYGRVVNFTDTTFAKEELAVNTLRKVKSA